MRRKSTHSLAFVAICQFAACADPGPASTGGSSSEPGTTTQTHTTAAPEPTTTQPAETTTTSSGTGTATSTTTTTTTTGDATTSTPTTTTTGAPDLCSVTTYDPLSAPLDIFIMLDRSSSMAYDTGDGISKWDAVTTALTNFALTDEAPDTRIGLQLFPRTVEGQDSCNVADYTKTIVPIYATPEVAPSLTDAMKAYPPLGNTTTGPALQGAIDYTRTWALEDPTRPIVLVLATDGVANQCTPLDSAGLAEIAAAGFAGSPSISTFVIGVLNADDIGGKQTIDAIASAGGTGSGFLLDGPHLDQTFLEALATIRGTGLPCAYAVPAIDPTLGHDDIVLQHTPDGQPAAQEIPHVADSAACDPSTDGWHYDIDPRQGTPTNILLCSQTCTTLATGGTLEIQVGCETRDAL